MTTTILPKQEIIRQYLDNVSIQQLMTIYKVGYLRIRQLLIEGDVKIRSPQQATVITAVDEQEIISKYGEFITIKTLTKQYKTSYKKIIEILHSHGIYHSEYRRLVDKYDLSFFSIDSDEKYYFFGFSLGDGCITKSGSRLHYTITLKNIDISVIENFCKWMNLPLTRITHYYNGKTDIVRLTIAGDIWNTDLSKFGLVPRKTNNPSKLDIPDEYLRQFILGFIDADGSISWKYTQDKQHSTRKAQMERSVSLVGHPYNMDWVIDRLRYLGFDGHINTQITKEKWKRIRIQRKDDIIKLVKILELDRYYDLVMRRKWEPLYNEVYLGQSPQI